MVVTQQYDTYHETLLFPLSPLAWTKFYSSFGNIRCIFFLPRRAIQWWWLLSPQLGSCGYGNNNWYEAHEFFFFIQAFLKYKIWKVHIQGLLLIIEDVFIMTNMIHHHVTWISFLILSWLYFFLWVNLPMIPWARRLERQCNTSIDFYFTWIQAIYFLVKCIAKKEL